MPDGSTYPAIQKAIVSRAPEQISLDLGQSHDLLFVSGYRPPMPSQPIVRNARELADMALAKARSEYRAACKAQGDALRAMNATRREISRTAAVQFHDAVLPAELERVRRSLALCYVPQDKALIRWTEARAHHLSHYLPSRMADHKRHLGQANRAKAAALRAIKAAEAAMLALGGVQ